MHGLPPATIATPIFQLYVQTTFWSKWNTDMRHVPHGKSAACNPQARCFSSPARLGPLRKRVRQKQIIQDTWEAIAASKRARTHDPAIYPSSITRTTETVITQAEYVYACPFCEDVVKSPVATGNIDHRRICGKQFRVENGVIRPTLSYIHTCPTCGTCIHSTKKTGRIQSKHKQANGRMCRRTEWQVK